jgi:hypothetical protein
VLEQLEPTDLMTLTAEDVTAAARALGEAADGAVPRRRRWPWAG